MLFAKPSTRASRNVEGISPKKKKTKKKTGADKEQEYEHKDGTQEIFNCLK